MANYRLLTDASPMMPLHLFGYIQSKERYVSSDDLINTLKEYRQRQIPIDMIVQDWNYWPEVQGRDVWTRNIILIKRNCR